MFSRGARFFAGHFFEVGVVLSLAFLACGGEGEATVLSRFELPVTGDVAMLVLFLEPDSSRLMPESASALPQTAYGRFYPTGGQTDVFVSLAEEADSLGKLLLLVVPENWNFTGRREHLIIRTDSSGIPTHLEPEPGIELFADSLWEDPVVRQNTLLQLIDFFKPDAVFQVVQEPETSFRITRFWSNSAEAHNITIALYTPPNESVFFRGWGILTGRGIRNTLLEGMDIHGFANTFRLIEGLVWNKPGMEHPAMQAFYSGTESK